MHQRLTKLEANSRAAASINKLCENENSLSRDNRKTAENLELESAYLWLWLTSDQLDR